MESSGAGSASCTSRYSASLSCPTDRASPKLTLGRFAKRIRTGNPASPRTGTRLLVHPEERDGRLATATEVLSRPLAPARRRDRRRDDVLERVIGAHPAVVARRPPAIGETVLVKRGLPVLPEEIAVQSGRDVVPRQDLVRRAMARDIPVGIEPLGRHRVEPPVQIEALAPLLERAAGAPHALDHASGTAVAPTGDALGERRPGIVPTELHSRLAHRAAQQRDLSVELVDAVLAEPLERRVRLGHETADRRRTARLLRVPAADLDDVAGQLGDAERVVVHLGGYAGEEVQLHP